MKSVIKKILYKNYTKKIEKAIISNLDEIIINGKSSQDVDLKKGLGILDKYINIKHSFGLYNSYLKKTIPQYLKIVNSINIMEKYEHRDDKIIDFFYNMFSKRINNDEHIRILKESYIELGVGLQLDYRRKAAFSFYLQIEPNLTQYEKLDFAKRLISLNGSYFELNKVLELLEDTELSIDEYLEKFKRLKKSKMKKTKEVEAVQENRDFINMLATYIELAYIVDYKIDLDKVLTCFDDDYMYKNRRTHRTIIRLAQALNYYYCVEKEFLDDELGKIIDTYLTEEDRYVLEVAKYELKNNKKPNGYMEKMAGFMEEKNYAMFLYQEANLAYTNKDIEFSKELNIFDSNMNKCKQLYLSTQNISLKLDYFNSYIRIKNLKDYMTEGKALNASIERVQNVEEEKTLVMSVSNGIGSVTQLDMLPIFLEAKKRGCIVKGIEKHFCSNLKGDDLELEALSRNIIGRKHRSVFLNAYQCYSKEKWDVDIENMNIEYKGVNVYQHIFDRISRWNFSYFMYLDENASSRYMLKELLSIYESVIDYGLDIIDWAERTGHKVRFLSSASHIWPDAAFLEVVGAYKGTADVEFVQVSPGFTQYFDNNIDVRNPYIAGINLTKNPNSRLALFGNQEGFEKFYSKNLHNIIQYRELSKKWFSEQRAIVDDNSRKEREDFIKNIKNLKGEGKKIYILNSKLIYDLAVRYTKGCAHRDMSHWATHTVECIKKNKNAILLIKAHPAETIKKVTMTSEKTDRLVDLIKTELSDNIIIIDAKLGIKNYDLKEYIDLALLWSGTSAMEFAGMGIKTIMADICGYYDYPIGFKKFSSLEEYEKILVNPDLYEQNPELPDKAILYLAYLASENVIVKNHFAMYQRNNYSRFTGKILKEKVESFNLTDYTDVEGLYDRIM